MTIAPPSLSRERLFGHVRRIAGIGRRWLGTPQEEQTVSYIEDQFRRLGYAQVSREELGYLNYQPRTCSLEVLEPVSLSFPCKPLLYSANGSAEGEVLSAGEGLNADFERLEAVGVSFAGKILMVRTFGPFDVTPRSDPRKVAGMVVVTDPPEGLIRNLTGRLYPPDLQPPHRGHMTAYPGVMVSLNTGDVLTSLLSTGRLRVRVSHEAVYTPMTTCNVVAEVKGREKPEEVVVVGGHYDTELAEAEFAWDNATGIAALLEIARACKERAPRRTVRFVAFSGEEIGCWGSAAYVAQHEQELLQRCVGMVNLDSLSSMFPAQHSIWHANGTEEFAVSVAEREGWKVDVTANAMDFPFTDYAPFAEIGIPSVFAFEFPPIHFYYHTEKDSLEFVDSAKLFLSAQASHSITWEMADTQHLPFSWPGKRG